MFSLAIYDTLTPGSLTGGRPVAGTGTIDAGRQGRPDRRHPAEDRRRPRGRRRAVPGARRQLRRRPGRPQRRHAAGQGRHHAHRASADRDVGRGPRRRAADLCGLLHDGVRAEPSRRPSRRRPRAGRRGARDRVAHRRRRAGTSRAGSTRWSTPPTLVRREPALASAMGLDDAVGGGLADPGRAGAAARRPVLESALDLDRLAARGDRLRGRGRAAGAAARTPTTQIPDDPAAAAAYAREHPDRQEVRIVAGATRAGATYCALRLRAARRRPVGGGRRRPGARAAGTLLRATLDEHDRRGTEDDQHERAVRRRTRGTCPRRPPAVAALARAGHHRDRAGARVLRPDDVLELLHRPALVPRRRLRRRLQHAALDPDRPVRGLRRADGRRGRRQHVLAYRFRPLFRPALARAEPASTATARPSPRSAPGWSSASRVLLGLFAGTSGGGGVAQLPALAQRRAVRPQRPVLPARTSASTSSTCPGATTSSTS